MKKSMIASGCVAALALAAGATAVLAEQMPVPAPTLSHAQAIEIALAEVPGQVMETELEREDGVTVYEIEIVMADGAEMEVEINADTGEILEVEAEDD